MISAWFRLAKHHGAFRSLKELASRFLPFVAPVLLALVWIAFPMALLVVPFGTQALSWLPKASEAHILQGPILGAQAAIAALTLAVTLFVMQGVSTRRDSDERVYAEYLRRSWVRQVFWGSIGAVAVTSVALVVERTIGDTGEIAEMVPGLPNLLLVAAGAFFANLLLAGTLFERAIRLTQPQAWRELRQGVNKRDVLQAIRVFLRRLERAVQSQSTDEPDFTLLFPATGEGSADQAIQSLLDDARRAMRERRLEVFTLSLASIKELVTYAMDEITKTGIAWGSPRAQPEWPPLRELQRHLYSFREEVIREGARDYVFELMKLDYWFISNGVKQSCGELFNIGVSSYRSNFKITTRLGGGAFHETFRDHFNVNLVGLTFGLQSESLEQFMEEAIRYQENMLSDAMHANRPDDFQRLHEGFDSSFMDVLHSPVIGGSWSPEAAALSNRLAQQYRVALMGLAGRASILAETGRIMEPGPYLDVARGIFNDLGQLGNDVSAALMNMHSSGFSQWDDWELEDTPLGRGGMVSPQRYSQTFFAIRIMELTEGSTSPINLNGYAQDALDWFDANSAQLAHLVKENPSLTVERRRQFAAEVLRQAVLNDEIEEQNRIIRRGISDEIVNDFASEVREKARSTNYIERSFQQAGMFAELTDGGEDVSDERGCYNLLMKAHFADGSVGDRISFAPYEGRQYGSAMSKDVSHVLCEALEGATPMAAPMDSQWEMLQAIQRAADDLNPKGTLVVVLAGDWGELGQTLHVAVAEGFEQYWHLSENDPAVVVGRYLGHLIFRGPAEGEPRLYVVEPNTWGRFVRVPFADGHPLRIEVTDISPEQALEMLGKNTSLFEDLPDDDSKVRKLQTYVEVAIRVRHKFTAEDQSRARKIIRGRPPKTSVALLEQPLE